MSRGASQKLVHAANQIAAFFVSQPGDPAPKVAAHLKSFWPPAMRDQIVAYVEDGGEGLEPAAREAVRLLGQRAA
jgi:formate dehydrogenase subunit delta